MFLMRLFFWKQSSKKTRKTTTCTLYVYSRFFYFVKSLNLLALGYAHTVYAGINGMMLQAGVTIFVVNLKRILKLKKR